MVDILYPQFWTEEHRRYLEALGPTALTILMAGAETGAAVLPVGYELLINWDYFNQSAIDFLKTYGMTHAQGITNTTQSQTVNIISDWIRSGESMDYLQDKLAPIYGKKRAEMIAVTEVTRIYAEGNILAWKATGLVGAKKWQTANDERVCPICGPLHGMIVGIDENGFTTEVGGLGLTAPPAHPRCRCWLLPVVSDEGFEESLDRILNG